MRCLLSRRRAQLELQKLAYLVRRSLQTRSPPRLSLLTLNRPQLSLPIHNPRRLPLR